MSPETPVPRSCRRTGWATGVAHLVGDRVDHSDAPPERCRHHGGPAPPRRAPCRIRGTGAAVEQVEAHRQFHVALVAMAGHRHLLLVYEPVILKLQLYMAANL